MASRLDDFKRYRDAGVQRVMFFSQAIAAQTAAGKALDFIKRFAPAVERAAKDLVKRQSE